MSPMQQSHKKHGEVCSWLQSKRSRGRERHRTNSWLNQSRCQEMPPQACASEGCPHGTLPQGPATPPLSGITLAAHSPSPLPHTRRGSCNGAGDPGWPWGTPGSVQGLRASARVLFAGTSPPRPWGLRGSRCGCFLAGCSNKACRGVRGDTDCS